MQAVSDDRLTALMLEEKRQWEYWAQVEVARRREEKAPDMIAQAESWKEHHRDVHSCLVALRRRNGDE